ASLAVVIYRKLLLPLTSYIGDDALILQVESKHKELGQSLISAAQLSRISDVERLGVSPSMIAATIRHGVDAAGKLNFGDVLNLRGWRRNIALLLIGILLTLALGVGIAQGGTLAIWFNRNLLLGEATWPQKTYLEIQGLKDGIILLPRGENWTQIVKVREDSEVVPDNVYIDFAGYGRPPQAMKRLNPETFETVFTNVIEEFKFRARGGDAVSEVIQVRLVEPPAAEKLTLHTTLPKYAGSASEELPAGKGPYYVIPGSQLKIAGVGNKPLAKAVLVIEPDLLALWRKNNTLKPEDKGPSAADLQAKLGSASLRFDLKLTDSKQFAGELPAWQPAANEEASDARMVDLMKSLNAAPRLVAGKYMLELTDDTGLVSKRPATFVVMFKDDREPRFTDARLVGVSSMVVPQAKVPYTARVLDDFALTKVELGHRARSEDSESAEVTGTTPIASLKDKLPAQAIKLDAADNEFEISSLQLQPGSSLTLYVQGTDNDEINLGGPKTGKSADFALRIVTEEQLRTDLLRREKEQRQEFERLLKNQEDLITDLGALAAGVAGTADFTDEQRLQLMAIQKRQNLVATNSGGVANVLEAITVEVLNNRLEEEGGKLESRLREKIIAPMRKIAELDVDEAVLLLEKARRVASDAAARDLALKEAQTQQQKIVVTMKQILESMAKAEGYQEAINLLYELEKAQKDVLERTRKEKEERIKQILQQGGKLPEEKKPEEAKPEEKKPEETPPTEKPSEKPADEPAKPAEQP
ncbi:MAG TPA: hypothetical protein VL096_01925, partial [Pirellulaceae bacterium]|nr:hypothetical protein [Pirellulaceae bacterium]